MSIKKSNTISLGRGRIHTRHMETINFIASHNTLIRGEEDTLTQREVDIVNEHLLTAQHSMAIVNEIMGRAKARFELKMQEIVANGIQEMKNKNSR